MKIIQIVLSFFVILSNASYASGAKELGRAAPKYQASQIITNIQKSVKDFYFEDDLFIGNPLFLEIKKKNQDIITKFKAEIEAVNTAIHNNQSKLVHNWSIRYYPEEDKVCARQSSVK